MTNKKYSMFFDDMGVTKSFTDVLTEVQEYISSKFSTLISDNPDEQKKQICSYIAKYLTDYNISVEGYSFDGLIDRLYAEMAEFSFLTQYLFATNDTTVLRQLQNSPKGQQNNMKSYHITAKAAH